MPNRTRIVATIGPSSNSPQMLSKLISAGMNVARLNFSHGSHEDHGIVIDRIRQVAQGMGAPICILADLQGPKIRTGKLVDGKAVELVEGAKLKIVNQDIPGTAECISTVYEALPRDVKEGDRILIDDGLMELRVLSTDGNAVMCEVIHGGMLKEKKGINLPGVNVSAPSLTEKDIEDIRFAVGKKVDYFALSFVRHAKDLHHIKSIIKDLGAQTPVIAKIEKPEAVENLDEILEVTDAIMVARGDLGVELAAEKVPVCQKNIIRKTMEAGKPVITATQMLESMITNPIPTRAEASDVANAIFDGTGAIMLSGETASGKFPLEAVSTMSRIAREAEASQFVRYNIEYGRSCDDLVTHAIAQSAVNLCSEIDAKAIITFTMSGKTAELISKQRPNHPVFAFTPIESTYNRMALSWGVTPVWVAPSNDVEAMLERATQTLLAGGIVTAGDQIVVINGSAKETGATNMIHVHGV